MIFVDTSAWIEFFSDGHKETVAKVDVGLAQDLIGIGDLIYCEIMQGLYDSKQRAELSALLLSLPQYNMVGFDVAKQSADNFRLLRTKGITIRKTIDVLIGTFCSMHGHHLIHHDRDFDRMAPHIGLKII